MTEPFLTAVAVGELLGFSAGWVLDRWEAGELPGYPMGRKGGPVRFRWSEIEAEYLAPRRRGSYSPSRSASQ